MIAIETAFDERFESRKAGEMSSPNPECFLGIELLFSKEGLVIWRLFCSYMAAPSLLYFMSRY
jgi:hypothetical protein